MENSISINPKTSSVDYEKVSWEDKTTIQIPDSDLNISRNKVASITAAGPNDNESPKPNS